MNKANIKRRRVPESYTLRQRIDFYSDPLDANGCRNWNGAKSEGYGSLGWRGKIIRANRAALELKLGRKLHPGKCALHTCDNRGCVAWPHLYEGTRHHNARDRAVRTGYDANHRGVQQHLAKLNDKIVRQIRASGESNSVLARRLGVNASTVRNVRVGRTWVHVPT